jgi:hypothetical protein
MHYLKHQNQTRVRVFPRQLNGSDEARISAESGYKRVYTQISTVGATT